ncbi:MAG: hypothetical protein E7230_01525 [Clostridiales bacterium]|nr:hypothetical protein [Clostridiales bacterium]
MKKNKTLKRFFAFLLCAAMVITYMPSSVFTLAGGEGGDDNAAVAAEATEPADEGTNTPSTGGSNDAPAVQAEPSETEPADDNGTVVEPADDQQPEGQEADGTETRGPPPEEEPLEEGVEEPTRATDTTWTVTFYDRDAEVYKTVEVTKGEAIGSEMPDPIAREDYNAYWALGEIIEGTQGPEIKVTGDRITSSYVPTADTVVVPDYSKISYTITFYENKDDTEAFATRTVDVDTSYCLNDIPQVPVRNGYSGKWVYSGGDFTNSVAASSDMKVWAEYEATNYTVTYKYMIDGTEKTYQTDEYSKGAQIELPTAPVEEGHEFIGWYLGDTQYTGGEVVNEDIELQGRFTDMYSVKFVVLNDDGTVKETLSQYFRTEGDRIETMPQSPFVSNKKFVKWVIEGTETEVTADTVVTGNFRAVAVFEAVESYTITVDYWYETDNGAHHTFDTVITTIASGDFNSDGKYIITPPASTQTDSELVDEGPRYYASQSSIEIEKSHFDTNHAYTTDVEYVAYTAQYDYVYLLKDLNGNGYTEIDRESNVKGVLGTYVTPTVKDFPYATLEVAEGATINQVSGQELAVKYVRKNYQLTYETNGGSYVGGTTAPYGTSVTLSSTVPTRTGYTFDGWYLDEALTQRAGASVTLNENTTVYAKWRGDTVNYTIVYLFEKYNDAGTSSSYVYDNSRDATGTVGSTVQAANAPTITRTGWEKDTERNAASNVVIEADGSSVLYVYYKLTEYTFHFRPGTYGNYNVTATLKGDEKTGNNNFAYTMKVKLGQDISSTWPVDISDGTYYYGYYDVDFQGWKPEGSSTVYVTKRLIVTEDMLPNSGTSMTYTASWLRDSYTYTVNYWLQNANNDQYTRSETYSQTYQSNNGNLSPKDIPGYTFVRRSDSGRTFNFYYDRDKFKIDYYYGSTKLNTIENVKFDATITGSTYNWTPTAAQCGVDSDYTFEGWYSDAGLTTKYTFSTMPASNLVLYAKWTPPSYTVSFDVAGGAPEIEPQTVVKGHKVEKPANPTKAGYTFDGWYTAAEGGQMYDWNTQITADTTIYAHWTQDPLSYTVHYVKGSETGEEVAPAKTVSNPNWAAGEVITEKALAIAGYRPDAGEKSVTLSIGSTNDIYFIYSVKSETTGYTVRYLEEGTNEPVHDPKVVTDVPGDTASVVEFAIEIDGLYPNVEEITYTLGSDPANNIITFYYSKYKSINVTVNFVDMEGQPIADPDTKTLKVGNTFTLSRTPIAGWDLNKAVKGASFSDPLAEDSLKITEAVIEANPNGLVYTLFYQKRLTITANSFSKQYDGTALMMPTTINDAVTVEGLADGDTLTGISFGYQGTDNPTQNGRINAGTATVTPAAPQISGRHNANYYKVRVLSGSLEVTKINVTIRIEPDRWTGAEYNGEVYKAGFTNPSKQISDYVIISHEGYRTEYLDDVWNAVKAKAQHDSSAAGLGYYGIAESDVGDYTWNLQLTTADLPQNDNYSVSLYVRPGRLQILPKAITVKANGGSKPYDGTPITAEGTGYTITSGSLADGDVINVPLSGSQTDLGDSPATVGAVTITRGEGDAAKDVTNNYTITKENGTLTVTQVTTEYVITVTGNNASYQYNGSEQSVNGYTVSDYDPKITFTGIDQDDAKATAKGTNAGTYTMTMSEADFSATSEYYTNIKIVVVPGKLTITKKTEPYKITVTGNSTTKIYNGSEQSVSGYTVSEHDPSITVTGPALDSDKATAKGTNVGTYTMTLSESDFTATSANYDNIQIEVVPGTLEITPITDEYVINVTGNSDTKVYNGSEQSVSGYTVSTYDSTINFSGIDQDDAKATAKGTNAGTYTMTMAAADFSATSNNYTNIKINVVPGTLTITPIEEEYEITVTGHSDSKVYNRAEQSVSGYDVSDYDSTITLNGPAQDSAKATAKGTNVGTYTMTMTDADFTATSVNYTKIKVTVVPGTLEITPITDEYEITVTGNSDTKVYNGSEQSVSGYTVSSFDSTIAFNGIAQDDAKATAKGTNAGTYNMTMSAADFTATSDNYSNIKITVVPGTLTITPVTTEYEITVTGNSDTKVYNTEEQSVNGYTTSEYDSTITFTGIAQNDAKATAKGTNAGTYTMTMTKDDFSASSVNYTNIKITVVPGTLTITPITSEYEITVTGNSATKIYNASEQSVSGYTVSEFDPTITFTGIDQDDAKATAKGTNVGTYTMTMTQSDFNASSVNYTNIKITVVPGTLTISKKTDEYVITVTGNSATQIYKGSEWSVSGYTTSQYDSSITLNGPAQDDAKVTAKGTNAGTYTMTMSEADFTATSANYDNIRIVVVPGTLTITPIEDEYVITVTGNSDSKVYNGSEQSVNGYTVSTYDSSITFEGLEQNDAKATAKGTNVGSYTMTMTKDDFSASSVNYTNIKINVVPGTLTITPVTDEYVITVTGNSDSKVYNGAEQSVSGYTVSDYDSTINFTGIDQDDAKATAKGTNAGTYSMTMTKDDFSATSANYSNIKITVVPGTLTITPITDEYEITVTGHSDTKVYNGSEQSVNGYDVSEYDSTITFNGPAQDDAKATAKGTNAGTYTMTMAKADFTATSANYTNIKITVVPGTLTITKDTKPYVITVTGNSDSKVYNRAEQSVSGYTVSNYDSSITFTGIAQDDAKATAKGTNAGTYTMTMTKDDFSATSVNYTNIKINVEPGTLTITPITDEYVITVTGNSDSKVYNGSEQSVNGYTVSEYDSTITFNGPAQDADKATAKGTNAGTYTMPMTDADFTATSVNYTNIKVTVEPGTLTITPAKLPDDPDDPDDPANKRFDVSQPKDVPYNGQDQKQPVTITDTTSGQQLTSADVTVEYSNDVKNVGTVTVTITAVENGNYTGSFTRTYKITPAPITIKADDKTKVYGQADPELTVSIVSGQLYGDDEITYDISREAGENVGQYTIELKDGTNFILKALKLTKGNYEVTFENGTLTITPAPLTITTPSASRRYNGRALTATAATISGLVNGDQATVTATGSQTRVGSSRNTYSINWTSGSASNYDITENLGTLTVTRAGVNPPPGPGPGPDPEPEVIPDEPTPEVEPEPEVIPDDPTPTAGGVWALINLISAILTALGAIIALFRKKEEEDEDEQNMYKEEDEDDNRGKKMLAAKIAGALAGVAAPITFILTEDMSLPMALVDKWTVLMVIMLVVQIVAAVFNKKASELDDDDEAAEATAN